RCGRWLVRSPLICPGVVLSEVWSTRRGLLPGQARASTMSDATLTVLPSPTTGCCPWTTARSVNAEPIFEQADLPAHGPMGDIELFRRAGETGEPCGSLEGLHRIQRR